MTTPPKDFVSLKNLLPNNATAQSADIALIESPSQNLPLFLEGSGSETTDTDLIDMRDVDFYIGYDSRYQRASTVCMASMARFPGIDGERIHLIDRAELEWSRMYYGQNYGNTEFTYTRFLVPQLNHYTGIAVFCDNDFLWRRSPQGLMLFSEQFRNNPVSVVKHELWPEDMHGGTKMDDKPQIWYEKKNWSSLMVFNCAHPDCHKLDTDSVSLSNPKYLHQFEWASSVGELPKTFNALVGYAGYPEDPVAYHFTDGGPWIPDLPVGPEALEWLEFEQRMKGV